ncbi:MAG: helix-turn-helix transcriptional regulator [Bacteroidota bacterium]
MEMLERIQLILKVKNMSASQFADKIGVQRSGISHILSGRNQPSLDFITRILNVYPDINPEWLIHGAGIMIKPDLFSTEPAKKVEVKKLEPEISPLSVSVPPEPVQIQVVEKEVIEPTKKEEPAKPLPKSEKIPVKIDSSVADKEIERIVIFFKNGTFSEYRQG